MKEWLEELGLLREGMRSKDLERTLRTPAGIDFSSNDYLGLAADPALRLGLVRRLGQLPALGAPASRLLRGNTAFHQRLEERLAQFKGTEAALLFPSGYQANVGLLTAVIRPEDRVLSDQLNHASLIDGLRLSGAKREIFRHLDVEDVEKRLRQGHAGGRTFLVTESLFSMDGDVAPLDRYCALTRKHQAVLLVDDAHATGVFGEERGSGLTEHFKVAGQVGAVVSTFGKALGLAGAFVAGPQVVIHHLLNHARSFVFSTASPPLLLAAIESALDLCQSQPDRRERLHQLSQRLRDQLKAKGVPRPCGRGPIVPILVGENRRALEVASRIQAVGFDVRAVRPPTVAEGTARLRVSVHANHTVDEIDALANKIAEALHSLRESTSDELPAQGTRAQEVGF